MRFTLPIVLSLVSTTALALPTTNTTPTQPNHSTNAPQSLGLAPSTMPIALAQPLRALLAPATSIQGIATNGVL